MTSIKANPDKFLRAIASMEEVSGFPIPPDSIGESMPDYIKWYDSNALMDIAKLFRENSHTIDDSDTSVNHSDMSSTIQTLDGNRNIL